MRHPTTINPQQRLVADMLALGVSPDKVASATGVPASHIKVWLKGSLFMLEVDRARERTMKKRRDAFMKRMADELEKNLDVLALCRDDTNAKYSDRLRAVELMVEYGAVPLAKRGTEDGKTEVRVVIEGDKARQVNAVLDEIDVTPERDN